MLHQAYQESNTFEALNLFKYFFNPFAYTWASKDYSQAYCLLSNLV